MVKTSGLIRWIGLLGVLTSGVINALFLYETLHMVTIQVPIHTLQPYQTITLSDLSTKQISAASLDAEAVTTNLIGRVTAMTIPQGDQVQRFELAQQGSLAQVIQNLYVSHPNDAFTNIQVQNSQMAESVQPGQRVNFVANNMTYPNVWVLSVVNPNAQVNVGNEVNQAVQNFISVNASNSPTGGTLTMLVGAPWSTVQALMSSSNTQVVTGNVGAPQYSLGSPPVSQTMTNSPSPVVHAHSYFLPSPQITNIPKKAGKMVHVKK